MHRSLRLTSGGEPLLLPTDTLEGLAVGLLVHEPAGLRVPLHPVPVRGLDLRAVADRTDSMAITDGGVLSQQNHLLSPPRICRLTPPTERLTYRLSTTADGSASRAGPPSLFRLADRVDNLECMEPSPTSPALLGERPQMSEEDRVERLNALWDRLMDPDGFDREALKNIKQLDERDQ